MRYSIDHVLEGIQLHRQEQLTTNQRGYARLDEQATEVVAKAGRGAGRVAAALRAAANRLDDQSHLYRSGDTERAILGEVQQVLRNLPQQYDLDKVQRDMQHNLDTQRQLEVDIARRDTRLEQFLRALQQGGETHVSQHSLKQAGFDGTQFTNYVLARANAQTGD